MTKTVKEVISERSKIKSGIKCGDVVEARRQTCDGNIIKLEGVVTHVTKTRSTVLFSNGDEDTYKPDEELKVKSRRTPRKPALAFCAVTESEDNFVQITPVFKGADNPTPFICVVSDRSYKYAKKLAERINSGEFISDLSYVVKRDKLIVNYDAEFPVFPNTKRGEDKAIEAKSANARAVRKLVK